MAEGVGVKWEMGDGGQKGKEVHTKDKLYKVHTCAVFFYLPVCLCLALSLCVSLFCLLSVLCLLFVSTFLAVSLFLFPSVLLSASLRLSVCVSLYLSLPQSHLSIGVSVSVCMSLSPCLSVLKCQIREQDILGPKREGKSEGKVRLRWRACEGLSLDSSGLGKLRVSRNRE